MTKKKTFLGSLIIVLFSYAIFFVRHYSLDLFAVYYAEDSLIHVDNKRYLAYVMDVFLKKRLNPVNFQWVYVLVLIISLAVCLTIITHTASDLIYASASASVVLLFICAAAFVNIFYSEWFIYAEIGIYYALSIFFATIAVVCVSYENHFLAHHMIPLICVFISLMFYQASMPVFVVWGLIFTWIRYQKKQNRAFLIRESINILFIGGIASVLAILSGSVYSAGITERKTSISPEVMIANGIEILKSQRRIWGSCYSLMPKYLLFASVLIMGILLLIYTYRKRKSDVFILLIVLGMAYAIVFAPHLIVDLLWLAPRAIVGWFSWISGLGVLLFSYTVGSRMMKTEGYFFGLLLVILIIQSNRIGYDQIQTNTHEKEEALQLQQYIEEYEEQTGNTVKKIAVSRDASLTYVYPEIRMYTFDINARCYSVDWGDVTAVNFFCNTEYERIDADKPVFENKNWDSFQLTEQCYFKDDVLYWCIY